MSPHYAFSAVLSMNEVLKVVNKLYLVPPSHCWRLPTECTRGPEETINRVAVFGKP